MDILRNSKWNHIASSMAVRVASEAKPSWSEWLQQIRKRAAIGRNKNLNPSPQALRTHVFYGCRAQRPNYVVLSGCFEPLGKAWALGLVSLQVGSLGR